jgi:hypothetical protein
VQLASTGAGAGTTDHNSDSVDTNGFGGCAFLAHIGAITASAVTSVHLEGSLDGSTNWTDLVGTNIDIADDEDDTLFILDASNHLKAFRYLRCVVDRGTQNAVVQGITAILYNAHSLPTSHHSSVTDSELHTTIAAGTI